VRKIEVSRKAREGRKGQIAFVLIRAFLGISWCLVSKSEEGNHEIHEAYEKNRSNG
jgi:hypothetical protein